MATPIEPERIRLLADRLCWLEHGDPGVRWRTGLWRADKSYWDKYDRMAAELAPEVFKPALAIPEPVGWKQLNLLGV